MNQIVKLALVGILGSFLIVALTCGPIFAEEKNYPGINTPWTDPVKTNFKGTIEVGDLSDLTGPAGKTVMQCTAGLADWFRYQNEYLGGVEGYEIKSKVVDTKFDPQNIINAFNRFIDEGKPIIYSVIAYTIPAGVKVCQRREVPVLGSSGPVSMAFLTPEEEKKGEHNYFFQMSPVVASRMAILVKFCLNDWKSKGRTGKPKFGTFNWDNENGHEAATAAKIYAEGLGGEFTVHTFHGPTITDAKAQVTALKKAKADYILGGPDTDQPLTVFALEMYRQKDKDWMPVFAGHTDFGTAYLDTGHKAFEGNFTYQYCLSWEDANVPIIRFTHDINKKWHSDIEKRPYVYNLGIQGGIVISEIYRRAIQKFGSPDKLTGVQAREIMETFHDFDPLGISGPVTWTHADHQGVDSLRIAECKDKKLVGVGGFVRAEPLTPEQRYSDYWLKD
jgi:branched-chain amino acid transport system substrate-binding protein